MQPFDPRPVTLEDAFVRLEPMTRDHTDGIVAVAAGRGIFRYFPTAIDTPDEVRAYVEYWVSDMEQRGSVTFVTVDLASGRTAGATSFLAIDRRHRKLEIESTWLAPEWQRTAFNTEAKYLQLRHCFEELGAVRVEFKMDSLNEKSRAALARNGAKEEGTMRNQMIVQPGGRNRHSVYFSVIESEWPDGKARPEQILGR